MIDDELNDFDAFWRRAIFEEDGSQKFAGTVDYSNLLAWSKGNSISVDQSTISMGRSLMTLLADRLRNCLIKSDEGRLAMRHWDRRTGATLTDLEKEFSTKVRMAKKYSFKINRKWFRIESILQELFIRNNIDLYWDDNTLIFDSVKRKFTRAFSDTTNVESHEGMHISEFLSVNSDRGAHIRLSHENKNWDVYIRDRYGAPPGVFGVEEGNLEEGLALGPKYLQADLHLAYGETIARKVSWKNGKERGLNQYKARVKICDLATSNDGSISLDAYYRIFAIHGAGHMADYYLTRSVGDRTAAEFQLHEVEGSDPKSWLVGVDPGLIRWRELHRDRRRERGDDDDEGEGSE